MDIQQLIDALEIAKKEHGNIEVYVLYDGDLIPLESFKNDDYEPLVSANSSQAISPLYIYKFKKSENTTDNHFQMLLNIYKKQEGDEILVIPAS